MKARVRAWRAANPDRARLAGAKKMRRRRGAPKVPFTLDQLDAKLRYWGYKCWLCGVAYEAVDHVKPLSADGWHMLANLRPICNRCNSRKSNRWPFDTATRLRAAAA